MLKPYPEPEGKRVCRCQQNECLKQNQDETICAAQAARVLANGYHPGPVWETDEPDQPERDQS